jgi:uncharacterized protein
MRLTGRTQLARGRDVFRRTRPAACAILLFFAACASSVPMRFYTLSDVAPARADQTTAAAGIRVTRVRIPGELDRNEIVQRIDANRVSIAEQHRWAGPLNEMIRRVLTADLQARGSGTAGGTLSLDIDEFIGDTTCAVTLRASWELKGANESATNIRSGQEVIHTPPPTGSCSIAALPARMSAALAELSDRILAAQR